VNTRLTAPKNSLKWRSGHSISPPPAVSIGISPQIWAADIVIYGGILRRVSQRPTGDIALAYLVLDLAASADASSEVSVAVLSFSGAGASKVQKLVKVPSIPVKGRAMVVNYLERDGRVVMGASDSASVDGIHSRSGLYLKGRNDVILLGNGKSVHLPRILAGSYDSFGVQDAESTTATLLDPEYLVEGSFLGLLNKKLTDSSNLAGESLEQALDTLSARLAKVRIRSATGGHPLGCIGEPLITSNPSGLIPNGV
jgi:hypothetical protein